MESTVASVQIPMKSDARFNKSPHSPNFHGLLASIDAAAKRHEGGKIILFASTHPGEGKSSVISKFVDYLAARPHLSVAMIDAGLRNDLSSRFASATQLGSLTTQTLPMVIDKATKVRTRARNIAVAKLDAETQISEEESLGFDAWAALAERFDYVFVEVASNALGSFCLLNAKYLDGVIIIVEAARTRWPAIENLREQLERTGATPIGVFLNKRTFVIPQKIYQWL